MEEKDIQFLKGTISGAVIMMILIGLGVVLFTGEDKEPEPIKERSEIYLSTCESWEICDYRQQMFGCTSMHCPETYQCWWESRNCVNSTLKPASFK